jgi:hypothetical protein
MNPYIMPIKLLSLKRFKTKQTGRNKHPHDCR